MNSTVRTIKITAATVMAVLIAQFFELDHTLSAGIISILSVLDTKQQSIRIAAARLGSAILGFSIASMLFSAANYTLTAFGVFLLIFIPIAHKMGFQSGIAPTSVLVTHFMSAQSISWNWQLNGIGLMFIGVATALFVNLWMPSKQEELERNRKTIEEEMRMVFVLFQAQLKGENNHSEIRNQLRILNKTIHEMDQTALHEFDNQFFQNTSYFIHYAQMRKEQLSVLQKMCDNLPLISLATEQNEVLADLFKRTAEQLHEKNTGVPLMKEIADLYSEFKRSELPKTRAEFESRAVLFQLLNDFERFIKIKLEFYISEQSILDE